jgi:hypothetical protein
MREGLPVGDTWLMPMHASDEHEAYGRLMREAPQGRA